MEERSSFAQHLMSHDQLHAGLLADIDDIQVPDEPIAMVSLSAMELSQKSGIEFQKSFDDLDSGEFAVLKFSAGFTVVLKDYFNSPVKGIRIFTDPDGSQSRSRLGIILDSLHLSSEKLIWISPDIQ